ncbi:hypothetical protein [Runella sp.]|jgi:hypothetical protein|uniref:hypothetical protein n=1 Tax=Runella sp. TaxID=1960881 RepID=UPI0030168ECC
MKKNLFVLLMAVPCYAFAQTADEIAVKKVVMAESDARDDFEAWIDCYADSPQTSYVNTGSPGSAVYHKNFEEVKEAKKKSLAASPKSGFTLDSRDGWVIRVVGDMAWVRSTQHFTILATNTKLTAFDLKVLEKINGQWKISTAAWIGDFRNATPPMRPTY